jgi:hypothetical protein
MVDSVLKRHGFSRAVMGSKEDSALATEGMQVALYISPQGLKPAAFLALFGTAEAVPFQSCEVSCVLKIVLRLLVVESF